MRSAFCVGHRLPHSSLTSVVVAARLKSNALRWTRVPGERLYVAYLFPPAR